MYLNFLPPAHLKLSFVTTKYCKLPQYAPKRSTIRLKTNFNLSTIDDVSSIHEFL